MESPKAERLLRVGLVQMNTVPCEAAENRKTAERLIRRAAEAGADLVVLPETWNVGFFPRRFLADLADPEDGESRALLSRLAKELGVAVAGGSIPTRRGGSIAVSPWGEILAEAGSEEELVVADLRLEAVREARRAMNVLADRRPELYEGLSRPVPSQKGEEFS